MFWPAEAEEAVEVVEEAAEDLVGAVGEPAVLAEVPLGRVEASLASVELAGQVRRSRAGQVRESVARRAGRPGTGVGGVGGAGRPGAGVGGVGGAGRPGAGVGGVGGAGRPGAGIGGVGGAGLPGIGPGGVGVRPGGAAGIARGTHFRSAAVLGAQGVAVRNSFAHEYPGLTARWLGPTWRPVAWAAMASYCGYPSEPSYCDYGTTTVYEGDTVYVNGDATATEAEYASQATAIAEVGQQASPPQADEFLTLGVFGMVQGEETIANQVVQLKVNKEGIIQGEYYNATTDTTETLAGSVDKETQRAAWTVGENQKVVYEAGIANLTKPETTMLIHYGSEKTQQWTLVRIENEQQQAAK